MILPEFKFNTILNDLEAGFFLLDFKGAGYTGTFIVEDENGDAVKSSNLSIKDINKDFTYEDVKYALMHKLTLIYNMDTANIATRRLGDNTPIDLTVYGPCLVRGVTELDGVTWYDENGNPVYTDTGALYKGKALRLFMATQASTTIRRIYLYGNGVFGS